MKIKVGRRYKTRDERTAFVFNGSEDGFRYYVIKGGDDIYACNSEGKTFPCENNPEDLVAPWPKKVKTGSELFDNFFDGLKAVRQREALEKQLKKPVYQWVYYDSHVREWFVMGSLKTKEQAESYFGVRSKYRIHAGPFEGSEP